MSAKLALAFALVASLPLAGCVADASDTAAASQGDEQDFTGQSTQYFVARKDTRKCAAPACGGYFVARPNLATTTCADGKAAAECYVADIDLSTSGLTDAQRAAVLGKVITTKGKAGVVFAGSLANGLAAGGVTYGRLRATDAFVAPKSFTLGGTLYRAFTETTCPAQGCTSLFEHDVNTLASRPLAHLDLGAAPGTSTQKNDALVGAYSPRGVLALGANAGDEAARSLGVTATFTRVDPGDTLCGDDLAKALADAANGWLWMSESDYPVHPVSGALPASGKLAYADVRALVGAPPTAKVDERSIAVFEGPGRNDGDMAPSEVELATHYRALRHALERNLTHVRVFYVGHIQLDVVVVGITRCGTVAGVRTTAIET
jgi:hypothetical protein